MNPARSYRDSLRAEMLTVANKAALRPNSVQERRNTMTAKDAKITVLALALIACAAGLGYIASIVATAPAHFSPSPQNLVPLGVSLPRPVFQGTRLNIVVPNLEPRAVRPHLVVPSGTSNVALGKPVTSSDDLPIIGEIEYITDGDKEATDGSYVDLAPGLQHVTIDLDSPHQLFAVSIWHYHKEPRVYLDCIVQLADDADFVTNVRTLFNNDHDNSAGLGVGTDLNYVETYEGKLIDAKGQTARYVRLYSNGNSNNDLNQYIEVEVYGKPVQ